MVSCGSVCMFPERTKPKNRKKEGGGRKFDGFSMMIFSSFSRERNLVPMVSLAQTEKFTVVGGLYHDFSFLWNICTCAWARAWCLGLLEGCAWDGYVISAELCVCVCVRMCLATWVSELFIVHPSFFLVCGSGVCLLLVVGGGGVFSDLSVVRYLGVLGRCCGFLCPRTD